MKAPVRKTGDLWFESRLWRISAHSPTFPSLHLSHISFSNPSVALPASQFILQTFRCFIYVKVHSPALLSLLLRHKQSSFSNHSVISPTSQLILQPFRSFTIRHSSFSKPSVASPTSQFILQPFFRFSYITSSSLTVIHLASCPSRRRYS